MLQYKKTKEKAMNESKYEKLNTVKAKGQLESNQYVKFTYKGGDTKVLFVGNSITRHGIAPNIGWHWDWGMAASAEEKDYVHQTVRMLEEKGMKVDFAVAQAAVWETRFDEDLVPLNEFYTTARDFCADVVIVRIGENMKKAILDQGKPYFDNMIRFFASNPNAKVIVTDSFWPHPIRDPFIKEICDERGYTFCKISDLGEDEKCMAIGLFEHKGVAAHPGDYGMEMIARRIAELIP